MSWNPQINFKLRDDQVAFGDMIIDKNGAQYLSDMLIKIKNGETPDIGLMKDVLDQYCFTNEEFVNLKNEMSEIQNDINEFKRIGSNSLQKWGVFLQTISVHTSYIVGSDTWIERYKELKMIAANLYEQIIRYGYNFPSEKKAEYDKRYSEILGCTTGMERVSDYLERQYREGVLRGDPNALNTFLDSMVETGVWSREAAERERHKRETNRLLNEAEGNRKYTETLEQKRAEAEQREAEQREREERTRLATENANDKYVLVTQSLLEQWNKIITDEMAYQYGTDAVLAAQETFVSILREVDKECDSIVNVNTDTELTTQYNLLWSTYSMPSRAGLIEMATVMIPESKISKITALMNTEENIDTETINKMLEEQQGTHVLTSTELFGIYEDISKIVDENQRNGALGLYFGVLSDCSIQIMNFLREKRIDQLNDEGSREYAYYHSIEYAYHSNNGQTQDAIESYLETVISMQCMDLFDMAQPVVELNKLGLIQGYIKPSSIKVVQAHSTDNTIMNPSQRKQCLADLTVTPDGMKRVKYQVTRAELEDWVNTFEGALQSGNSQQIAIVRSVELMSYLENIIHAVVNEHIRIVVLNNCREYDGREINWQEDAIRINDNVYWIYVTNGTSDYTGAFKQYLSGLLMVRENHVTDVPTFKLFVRSIFNEEYQMFWDNRIFGGGMHIDDWTIECEDVVKIDKYLEQLYVVQSSIPNLDATPAQGYLSQQTY